MCAWYKGILSLLWEKDSFLYIAGNVMPRDDPCVPPNSISANDFVLWIVRTMYLAITENLRAWTTSTEPPLWWPQIFRSWFKMSPPCKGCWSMLIHRSARAIRLRYVVHRQWKSTWFIVSNFQGEGLRAQLRQLQHYTGQLAKDTAGQLKQLADTQVVTICLMQNKLKTMLNVT